KNENETVGAAGPAITTAAGGTIGGARGRGRSDTALLAGGYNPTGTITFTLKDPTGKTVYTDTVKDSGNGSYSTDSLGTGSAVPTLAGTYLWSATYNGDGNNSKASDNGVNENETVGAAGPAITTAAGG